MSLAERTEPFTVADGLLTDVGGTLPARVLSTPGMIAMMERTAARLAAEHLADGRPTVGFEVCIKHVAGAGEGAECTATARLLEVAEGRKLRFEVEVREGDRVLGLGTHERPRDHAWLMAYAPPARHLLRARALADARFFEPLDVDDMARAAGLSRAHFSREFRRAFGESPHQYLLTRRLERAASLLRTTDRSVADICFSVGLQSVGSFTSSFTKTYGVSPTVYRARYPPAVAYAVVPSCIVRAYGRPQGSTFREDKVTARS